MCRGIIRVAVWALLLFGSAPAFAYEPQIHQQLTFLAARQFNECAQNHPQIQRLSALDTRYVVRSNAAQADGNFFVRMFRWNYYNRLDQSNRTAWYLIDTRFHQHFEGLLENVDEPKDRQQQLRDLGRLVNYIQNVTSPPHVVPVYTGRWWRLSWSDRFDSFPLDAARVEAAIAGNCEPLVSSTKTSYKDVLVAVAESTIEAVREPIYGFPTTWESYWKLAEKSDEFGEYGPAGNHFGVRAQFRCGKGERCLLLKDDPLYRDFAFERHVAAALATMRAFGRLQAGAATAAAQ